MQDIVMLTLIAVDGCLFLAFFIMFFLLRNERKRRSILEENTNKIAGMLEEMIALNESAFRNVTRTIRTLESGIKKSSIKELSSTEKKHRILRMLNNGFSMDDIAQRLNVPKGEVELVANLGQWMMKDQLVQAERH